MTEPADESGLAVVRDEHALLFASSKESSGEEWNPEAEKESSEEEWNPDFEETTSPPRASPPKKKEPRTSRCRRVNLEHDEACKRADEEGKPHPIKPRFEYAGRNCAFCHEDLESFGHFLYYGYRLCQKQSPGITYKEWKTEKDAILKQKPKRGAQIANKAARERQKLEKKKGTVKMTERRSKAKAASSAPKTRKAADKTASVNLKRKKEGTSVMPEQELTSKATKSAAQERKAAEETATTVVMKIKKEKNLPASNVAENKQAFLHSEPAVLKNVQVDNYVSTSNLAEKQPFIGSKSGQETANVVSVMTIKIEKDL